MGAASRKTRTTGLIATAGLAAVAGAALAQDGGLNLTGRFAETLEFSDNPDFTSDFSGTALRSRTDLSFGLESVTAEQSIAVDFGAAWRYTLSTSDDQPTREGLTDPFFVLAYERNSATSLLSFSASYRESDTGDLSFVVDPDSQDLVVDDGTVARTGLNFGLETGIGEPFGLSIDANYQRRVYTDTFDPDLTDNEFFRFAGRARFQVTPTTAPSLIAIYSDDNDFDTSDYKRITTRLGFGINHELSQTQTIGLDITSDVIDTTENGTTTTDEGYSFVLAYGQELTNGDFSVEVSSVFENIGEQNTVSFSRNLDLPDGELAFLVGLNNYGSSDIYGLLGIEYTREFRDAVLSARVQQRLDQDTSSNDEFLNRLLEVDYSKEINSVSGWQTSFGYFQSEDLTDGSTTEQTNFQVSYRRDLTRDWNMVGGYRYRNLTSTTEADRNSNTIFLTIQRDFFGRP
jgi:hypothetical protein